jgi:hypothetical protein
MKPVIMVITPAKLRPSAVSRLSVQVRCDGIDLAGLCGEPPFDSGWNFTCSAASGGGGGAKSISMRTTGLGVGTRKAGQPLAHTAEDMQRSAAACSVFWARAGAPAAATAASVRATRRA